MLRKLSVIAAIVAALAIPGAAMAAKHGGGHHGGHKGGHHGHWKGGHGKHWNKNWGGRHYGWRGHGRYWRQIYEANPGKAARGGNLILIGTLLILPLLQVPAAAPPTGPARWCSGTGLRLPVPSRHL